MKEMIIRGKHDEFEECRQLGEEWKELAPDKKIVIAISRKDNPNRINHKYEVVKGLRVPFTIKTIY